MATPTLTLATLSAAQVLATKLITVNQALTTLAGNPSLATPLLSFAGFPPVPTDLVPSAVFNTAFTSVLQAEQTALVAALEALGAPTT
jgi:hypothetical protein